jgi:hypothetical protein
MTLPFRRRHNDAEASHDRARAIMATGFLEPTEAADDAWLETHLASCPECRAELVAFQADRELLRTLRDQAPEPPRDLWARTAASIEHEAGHRGHAPRPRAARRVGRLPLGVMSGVLVILVVVGTSLFPRIPPSTITPTTPRNSDVAIVTPPAEATPLAVTANAVTWVEARDDGTYQLVSADLDEVCTADPEACAPIEDESTTRLTLPSEPEQVLLSKDKEQLVVVSVASEDSGSDVIIVDVPTPPPSPGTTPAPTPTPSPTPVVTPTPEPTVLPGDTPVPTGLPTASPHPNGTHSILSGVVVIGEAAYSADGQWLAFSARPVDGTDGPDLYTWRVGDPGRAQAVTADHRTFFAGWLGNLILASRVEPAGSVDPNASPDASGEPTSEPAATTKPGRTSKPGPKGTGTPAATASPDPSAAPAEDHPISFLYDPTSEAIIDLAGDDIWRPVVDTASRTIVYWSGTLVPDETGTGWAMGTGELVIDGWIDPALPEPAASLDPGATPSPTPTPSPTLDASLDPFATPLPTPPPGPAGSPHPVAAGPIADFEASFDPTGTRLAVWILDPANPTVGTLRLIVIDAETGTMKADVDPLPGVAALRGFSIGEGRLAWVTPPGQDGESSHVHVLGWDGEEFGQVRSIAADRFFVVR